MAKDLLKKYIWLIDTIRMGGITFEEINERWRKSSLYEGKDIPLRTFHHRRNEIEELFGVCIACDKCNGYTYSIENSSELRQGYAQKWLLNTFSVSNILSEGEKIKDRIQLEDVPSAQQFLVDIIRAMRINVAISVSYKPFASPSSFRLTLQPYFVKLYEGRWYLYAKRENESVVKVYALDRMKEVKATKQHFKLLCDFSPQAHLSDVIGVAKYGGKACEIRLKAFGVQAEYLRTLPLHHSQEEVEKHDGCTIFRYWLSPTPEFYQKILAQRERVQILSPPEVRQEMKKIVALITKNYKKKWEQKN